MIVPGGTSCDARVLALDMTVILSQRTRPHCQKQCAADGRRLTRIRNVVVSTFQQRSEMQVRPDEGYLSSGVERCSNGTGRFQGLVLRSPYCNGLQHSSQTMGKSSLVGEGDGCSCELLCSSVMDITSSLSLVLVYLQRYWQEANR